MDDEQIQVAEHFKYLGSLKSADGNNCNNPELEWPRKNPRSGIVMVRQRNKQRADNWPIYD